MLEAMAIALELPHQARARVDFVEEDRLPSCWPVSDLAAASIAAAATALSDLVALRAPSPPVSVSYRSASLWFGWSIKPVKWQMPDPWDAIAGDYAARDGWIKIHTNAPHHREAALAVLKCEPTREAVSRRVAQNDGQVWEDAIVAAGGCAAWLRSAEQWASHPQGRAVVREPLIIWDEPSTSHETAWQPSPTCPLSGLRVLDLTRIIAGPVATRFLAGYGADVLRIDPPDWQEDAVAPEVTLGKRCARLDFKTTQGRDLFRQLLSTADILVHGYRTDALAKIGFGASARQRIRPGLIDISLNAYGHSGPWQGRRGFDSLVQFSTGIAAVGMDWRQSAGPVSLPVQALDHATGYLLAAAAIRALIARTTGEGRLTARLSLARTAKLLIDHRGTPTEREFAKAAARDYGASQEQSAWGPAYRLLPPVTIEGAPMFWERPASQLGSSSAA
jgi:crotonobetainyl-CoA:carnitine CoA-transferase CaiB-like acyl-CoA transferase